MEQRSQILKQMHLTKNEREREVRVPGWCVCTGVGGSGDIPGLVSPPHPLTLGSPAAGGWGGRGRRMWPLHLPNPLPGTLALRQTFSTVGDF